MHAAEPSALIHLTGAETTGHERSYLILGSEPPAVPGTRFIRETSVPCAAIILLGRIESAEFYFALDNAVDPAIPVADFGGNVLLRRDFVGTDFGPASIREIEHAFGPIWRRLEEVPYRAPQGERDELAILRLAYSRDRPIEGILTQQTPRLVEYPLLGAGPVRRQLEVLAEMGLLHRTHFTRTHACGKCESARLHVYEACPTCGSADLHEESLVHHYRCGHQEAESHFAQGSFLICPKCHRSLRHIGVDYGKPGQVVVCASCGATDSQPVIRFVCLDCAAVTPAEAAGETDWYHYALTSEGILALRQGRLPHFDIGPLFNDHCHTYSPQEFRLLAAHELRVSRRYKRPFSIARLSILNLEQLLRERGAVATDEGFRRVVTAVLAHMRSSDFIGVDSRLSCVIGFPETQISAVDGIVERIRSIVSENVSSPVELGVETATGDDIIEFLERS